MDSESMANYRTEEQREEDERVLRKCGLTGWEKMDCAPTDRIILAYDEEGDYWLAKWSKYDECWMEEDLQCSPLAWCELPMIPNANADSEPKQQQETER